MMLDEGGGRHGRRGPYATIWDLGSFLLFLLLFLVVALASLANCDPRQPTVQQPQQQGTPGRRTQIVAATTVPTQRKMDKEAITIGVILPHSIFQSRFRHHVKKISDAIEELKKSKNPVFKFVDHYNLMPEQVFVPSKSSPIGELQNHSFYISAIFLNFFLNFYYYSCVKSDPL